MPIKIYIRVLFNQQTNMQLDMSEHSRNLDDKKKHRLSIQQDLKENLKALNQYALFPVGFSKFKLMLTQTNIFVDKTMFIKQIIDLPDLAILITRPRRWGKSLNMSMLSYFFKIDKNEKGQNTNRVLFEGGTMKIEGKTIPLKPLKIAHEKDQQEVSYIDAHQGKYPVIFMSWKDIQPSSYINALKLISKKLKKTFLQHKSIKDSRFQQQINKFNNIENSVEKYYLENVDITDSLQLLTQLLYQHHDQRVYVLIDEYDKPFNHILEQELKEANGQKRQLICNEKDKIQRMIRGILSNALKDNDEFLRKGILTGVFDILRKQAASGLNNLSLYGIASQQFSKSYGFSKKQIKDQLISKMFKNQNEQSQQMLIKLLNRISKWYNGYIVPIENDSQINDSDISYCQENKQKYLRAYNPYAVIKYLGQCISANKIIDGKSYWSISGSDSFLQRFFSSQAQSKLIGKVFSLNLAKATQLQLQESVQLVKIDFNKPIREAVLTFLLLNSGYVTGKVNQEKLHAVVPNHETLKTFKKEFQEWSASNKLFIDLSSIDLTNIEELKKKVEATYDQIKDHLGLQNEKVFNSLFAMRYLMSSEKNYSVSLEPFSGDGYIDNIFYPSEPYLSDVVIIHEYKYTCNQQKQKELYQEALWQIYEKNYFSHPIAASEISQYIKSIIPRPIVIVSDRATKKFSVHMSKDIIHSIEEAKKIKAFFSSKDVRQILGLNNKNRNKANTRKNLLQIQKVRDIHQLLNNISKDLKPKKQGKTEEAVKLDSIEADFFEKEARGDKEKQEVERIEDSMKKMNLNHSAKLDPFDFDYDYALSKLPHLSLVRRIQPNLPDMNSQKFKNISKSLKPSFPNHEQLLFASMDECAEGHQNILDKFRSAFSDSEQLYDATLDKINEVVHNTKKAQDIFHALQTMKNDPRYYNTKNQQLRRDSIPQ